MLAALYPTKKSLKAAIGQRLNYEETSFFGEEYKPNGQFAVVGPSPLKRQWYATVHTKDDLIVKVT